MKEVNDKVAHTSNVRSFFERHSASSLQDDPLLNHKWAHRWFEWIQATVKDDVYTFQEVLQGRSAAEVMINDAPFYMMSSYDYMGLIGHPKIEAAAIDAIKKYGTGTGGVRLLTG